MSVFYYNIFIFSIGLSLSSSCPGLLVSTCDDGIVKVWDVLDHQALQPVWESKSNVGKILCLNANPESPFIFSAGGDNKSNNYKVFDFAQISTGKLNFLIFWTNEYNSF